MTECHTLPPPTPQHISEESVGESCVACRPFVLLYGDIGLGIQAPLLHVSTGLMEPLIGALGQG